MRVLLVVNMVWIGEVEAIEQEMCKNHQRQIDYIKMLSMSVGIFVTDLINILRIG